MHALNPVMPSRRLWRYLWFWALGVVLAVWVSLAGVAYYTGFHEAEEISDGLLVSAADLLLHQPPAEESGLTFSIRPSGQPKHPRAYASDYHVLVWQDGRKVWDSHGMAAVLPPVMSLGHQTLTLGPKGQAQEWRAYVAESTDSRGVVRRVAVLLDGARRQAMGVDIAQHIVAPALVFLPLVAALLAWAILRGLRPLKRLSARILALDVDAGQSLTLQQPFQELGVTVNAINQLVQRLNLQISRERQFAADVAHELRTPLTSLVLQARLARDMPSPAEQAAALLAVEQGAMRAGRILSQLLDLARAQSLSGDRSEIVDLAQLAHQVTAEQVALAHDLGQDIALEVPDRAVRVPGCATLLELALRNLVDNALRHNPPDTSIEVRVGIDAEGHPVVAVSDDGLAHAPSRPSHSVQGPGGARPQLRTGQDEPPHRAGMGIGLTLVERIAQSQGARLVRDGAHGPFSKRYALVWDKTAQALANA